MKKVEPEMKQIEEIDDELSRNISSAESLSLNSVTPTQSVRGEV